MACCSGCASGEKKCGLSDGGPSTLDVFQLDPGSSFYTAGAVPMNQPFAGEKESWTLMEGSVSTQALAAAPRFSGMLYFRDA
jgi:hypothetical protein